MDSFGLVTPEMTMLLASCSGDILQVKLKVAALSSSWSHIYNKGHDHGTTYHQENQQTLQTIIASSAVAVRRNRSRMSR